MSVVEAGDEAPALEWRFDDPTDPTELTVYDPEAADETVAWLTADVADAVDLEDVL